MQPLNLPTYPFKLKTKDGQTLIFDDGRKKWLILTPEEWVRQHFIEYLVTVLEYPRSLLSAENQIQIGKLKRRVDICAHDRYGTPLVLVECKAPQINITQKVFDQVTQYNIALQVPVIVVTNGLEHFAAAFNKEDGRYQYLHEIPSYKDLQ